ncbi:MAG: 5'/3'-nucleotidase SurE [Planctomycetota bacterium]|nr:MAG: 5'/3'-nucleotidase SurE [Planctomycetota bacterium]
MNFLLTNDDGVDAPGIATLAQVCEGLGRAVILAPVEHLSGCSHQATTSRGLELKELAPNRYALDGAPVDCTRIGLYHAAPETQWVLSGINAGGNMGHDVYLSGTVAAAREACLLGKPAIAFSQYIQRRPVDWDMAGRWTRHVLEMLLERPPAPGTFWNVNLPQPGEVASAVPDCVFCDIDPHPLPLNYELEDGRLHYRARYRDRMQAAGRDVALCFAGHITISQIGLHSIPPQYLGDTGRADAEA